MADTTCSIPGCTYGPGRLRKGMCQTHYQRKRKGLPMNGGTGRNAACELCGDPIPAGSRALRYCSAECRTASAWGYEAPLTCHACGKRMMVSRTSRPQGEAICLPCRRDGRGAHGTSAYRRGCRCSECHAARREANRRYYAKHGYRRVEEKKRQARERAPECVVCGELVIGSRGATRPCHRKCKSLVPEYIWRGKPGPARRRALDVIEKAARGTTGGGVVWVNGPCAWCGEQFTGRGKAARYCCKDCLNQAKFAKRNPYAFKPSPVLRLAVYERDNWTCQVCDLPVDPSEHFRSDWAGSLDHIIPQAAMLIPDHSESNLRLVHRICNAYRGDNTYMTDDEVRVVARARYAEMQEVAA